MSTGDLSVFLVGNRVVLTATFSVEDVATDPTAVVFKVKHDAADLLTFTWPEPDSPEVTHPDEGTFTCAFDIDTPGYYYCRVEGTGAVHAAADIRVQVRDTRAQ